MLTKDEIFVEELVNAAYTPTENYRSGSNDQRKYRISSLITTTPMISHYEDDIQRRKSIKRAFRIATKSESADGAPTVEWFSELTKVFWFGWVSSVDYEDLESSISDWLSRKGNQVNYDDYSCVGYTNKLHGKGIQSSWVTDIGFIVNGDIGYACKDDAWSNEGHRIHKFVKNWYRNSKRKGVPRRPAAIPFEALTRATVLGPEDVPSNGIIGEIIIEKWLVEGIVINVGRLYGRLALINSNFKTSIDWFESLEELYPDLEIIYINDDRDKNPYWKRAYDAEPT